MTRRKADIEKSSLQQLLANTGRNTHVAKAARTAIILPTAYKHFEARDADFNIESTARAMNTWDCTDKHSVYED
jgi:hypothetical protein